MGKRGPAARGRRRRCAVAGTALAVAGMLAGTATGPAQARAAVVNVGCSDSALITAFMNSNSGAGDTLVLTSYCVYTLTDADGQLPAISKPMVIQGNNATIRRDPAATTNFRVMQLTTGGTLTMDTLTIMNGHSDDLGGGGLYVDGGGGALTTTNVNFQGNTSPAEGGAVLINSAPGAASMTGGTISDNRADTGGGIRADAAQLSLTGVTMLRNRSDEEGGALYVDNTLFAVTNGSISNNTAKLGGGGLHLTNGGVNTSVTITGTKITSNTVTNSLEGGGGILFDESPSHVTTITNATIAGNVVKGFTARDDQANAGGGIQTSFNGEQLTLDNTKVTSNQVIGEGAQGAGIAAGGSNPPSTVTLQNATAVTGNLASGRYSKGGGIIAQEFGSSLLLTLISSRVDSNKVTGTGSSVAGIYNLDATVALLGSSVSNNTAPLAPAPGGISTVNVPIPTVVGSTITGNTPTNCLLSPMTVTSCVG